MPMPSLSETIQQQSSPICARDNLSTRNDLFRWHLDRKRSEALEAIRDVVTALVVAMTP
jgi:hypothetical protein